MRITKSVQRHARKKKMMKLAKGFRERRKNCFRIAIDKIYKKLLYQYRDRRNIKRDMRRLWITRINAGLKMIGEKYSTFIHKLNASTVNLNRKSLADLAAQNTTEFHNLVRSVMGHSTN